MFLSIAQPVLSLNLDFVSSQVSNYYFSVPDFSVPNHHAKVFITPKKILNYLISTVGRVHKGISFKFQSQLSFRCATERCHSIRRQLYVTSALLVLTSIGTNCLLLVETAVVRTIIKLNHPLRSPIPIMDHNLK